MFTLILHHARSVAVVKRVVKSQIFFMIVVSSSKKFFYLNRLLITNFSLFGRVDSFHSLIGCLLVKISSNLSFSFIISTPHSKFSFQILSIAYSLLNIIITCHFRTIKSSGFTLLII